MSEEWEQSQRIGTGGRPRCGSLTALRFLCFAFCCAVSGFSFTPLYHDLGLDSMLGQLKPETQSRLSAVCGFPLMRIAVVRTQGC